jgi:DNA primase
MDAITAHEHGFTNVVASMGTAVTSEQLQQLSRLVGGRDRVGRVILCLDSDAAGAEATVRALEEALQQFGTSLAGARNGGMEVRVARSNGGKDPDEAIRSDADGWRQSLRDAVPLIEHLMDSYLALHDASTGDGKARVVQAVAPLIFSVPNDYDRDRWWTTLARKVDVPAERLKSLLPRRQPTSGRGGNRSRSARGNSERGLSAEQAAAYMDAKPWESLEEHLLVMLLSHDELREFGLPVAPEVFTDTVNREIFTAWRTSSTLGALFEHLDAELAERASQLAERDLPPADQVVRVDEVKQCIRRLSVRYHVGRIELQERMFEEQEAGLDEPAREELRKRVLEHTEALRQLHTQRA